MELDGVHYIIAKLQCFGDQKTIASQRMRMLVMAVITECDAGDGTADDLNISNNTINAPIAVLRAISMSILNDGMSAVIPVVMMMS